MSDHATLNTIGNIKFFRDLTEEQLQKLATISREVEFQANERIFEEHGPASQLYVIVSGRVSLIICVAPHGCRQIMEISNGELFGWSALLDRPRLTDTAQTVAPTKAVAFDGAQVRRLCAEDPELGCKLMLRTAQVLAERLYATRIQLLKTGGMHFPAMQIESD